MSFVPDCSRSVKRKNFGDALLRQAKDLDLPILSTIREGFRIKVLNLNGIEKITVNAPAGMVILCSTTDRILTFSSEYWLSALSRGRELSVGVPYPVVITEYPYDVAYPFRVYSYNIVENIIAIPGSLPEERSNCVPALMPFRDSEAVVYGVSFMGDLQDTPYTTGPDYSGEWYANQFRQETFIDSYAGIGKIEKRMCTIRAADYAWYSNSWTTQFLPGQVSVQYYGSNRLMLDSQQNWTTTMAWITKIRNVNDINVFVVGPSNAWGDLPEWLYTAISSYSSQVYYKINVDIVGSYAYTHPVTKLTTLLTVCRVAPYGSPVDEFWRNETTGEDPATRGWRLFYSIFTMGKAATETEPAIPDSSVLVNGDSIFPILSAIHGIPNQSEVEYIDWNFIQRAIRHLLPYPNVNHYSPTPHDSIMFHTPQGVYTWTRNNGSVFFGPYGFEQASIAVPGEVLGENGVRPLITYGSTDSYGNDTYLCICDRVGVDITAVYKGSPFSSWSSLPIPEFGVLVFVRPAIVRFDRVLLFGVVRNSSPEATDLYAAAFLYWTLENGGSWKKLSNLPDLGGEGHAWALAIYGNDTMVQMMSEYPSPPAATVQPYKLPYENYPQVVQ